MAKELKTAKPVSAFSAMAARISLAMALLYAILLLSLHVIKPDLDPTWRFISEYALGEHGWIMGLTFLSIAGSLGSLFLAIRTQIKTIIGYIGMFLLLLSAVGITIAAIYPTDPVTTGQDVMTESGKMHVFGASLDWTPFAALFISLSLVRTKAWSMMKVPLFLTASVPILLTVIFIVAIASAPEGKIGPGVYAGLIGRFLILSYVGWIAVVTSHIVKLRKLNNEYRISNKTKVDVS